MVFNKMDLVDAEPFRNRFSRHHSDAVFVSARDAASVAELRDALTARLLGREIIRTIRLPIVNLQALSAFHRTGSVLEQTFAADMCQATLRLTEAELNRLLRREGAVLAESSPRD
jgi:50S ribosomal subunit-associated GTPase HflX